MKQLSALLLFVLTLTVSCNNASNESIPITNVNDTATTVQNKIMIPETSCYASSLNKDTVQMKLEVFEKVVTGSLAYNLYEKDRNEGVFEGILKGDTLVAEYLFKSEGTQSLRQVVFLIKDGTATEGYGDMEEKNGKMVFKSLAGIVFGKGVILKKEACSY